MENPKVDYSCYVSGTLWITKSNTNCPLKDNYDELQFGEDEELAGTAAELLSYCS